MALPPDWDVVDESYSFEAYKHDFEKKYDSAEIEFHRKTIFQQNLRKIVDHNRQKRNKNDGGHALGVNHLMDLEPHELPFGYDKSLARELNHPTTVSDSRRRDMALMYQLPLPIEMEDVSKLPDFVDWRWKSAVTPVKDQGMCGSCWAFASIGALESNVALETSLLVDLSPQELVSCVPNPRECGGDGGCLGSIAQLAYTYVAQHGIVEEWKFGYESYGGKDMECSLKERQSSPLFAQAFATIEGFAATALNDYVGLMNVVAKVGPVVVSVAASSWGLYGGGVFSPSSDSADYDLNHAVVLDGYGTDAESGEDYWLIRNSWSPRWGEGGYIRLKRQDPATMEDPEEDCGMDVTPSDGDACRKDENGNPVEPPAIKICGTSGVYYQGVIPVGVRLV